MAVLWPPPCALWRDRLVLLHGECVLVNRERNRAATSPLRPRGEGPLGPCRTEAADWRHRRPAPRAIEPHPVDGVRRSHSGYGGEFVYDGNGERDAARHDRPR